MMRLRSLTILTVLLFPGPVRAADSCADLALTVATLKDDEAFQASTQLFTAARLGCEREARALLDRGAGIDGKDREGATPLAKAAKAGKTNVVSLLIDRGARTSTPDRSTVRPPYSMPLKQIDLRRYGCSSITAPIRTFPAAAA